MNLPLVEPHRVSSLYALVDSVHDENDSYTFEWLIGGVRFDGAAVEVLFTSTGTHAVTLRLSDLISPSMRYTTTPSELGHASYVEVVRHVICKYVRREIRGLFSEDRNRFLDAMQVLYNLPTGEGKSRYGSRTYRDAGYFAAMHNMLAGDQQCDHMHDGMGFLTQHSALVLSFEASLQAVDAAVSVPYWDYTIEGEQYRTTGDSLNKGWFTSPIFESDWFGPVPVGTDSGVVEEGRWAYTSVSPLSYAASTDFTTLNGYGLVRAPWNVASAPYLTRFNTTYGYSQSLPPNCDDLYRQLRFTEWHDFAIEVQYSPHGKVHTIIAGAAGADYEKYFTLLEEMISTPEVITEMGPIVSLAAFGFQKDMWRLGYLECPESCSADTDITCKCSCPLLNDWVFGPHGNESFEILHLIDGTEFSSSEVLPTAAWNKILSLFCNFYDDLDPVIGDLANAGAPVDPLFWPIHPTMDRLWQWWRLNTNGSHLAWADGGNYVHEHLQGTCSGHNHDDVSVWENMVFDGGGHDGSSYTNLELFRLMDPQNSSLPYVYDRFEWSHCVATGYTEDLSAKLVTIGSNDGDSIDLRSKNDDDYSDRWALSSENSSIGSGDVGPVHHP